MNKRTLLGAASALAIVAAFGPGCSGKKEPAPGELMLSVQSDMAIPKDIDAIRVEISASGSMLHGMTYTVGPSGEIRIPATIGVVEGSNPSQPVRIVITAQYQKHTRVLREVLTTVPTDRIALLRIPLQWLCDGQVTEPAPGQVQSSCPGGQTCVAGECVPTTVDSATLETYRPELVYGGAAGPDLPGQCLDTVECFSHGYQVVFNDADCSIEKPSGGVGVNVALFGPPDTVGICGPHACLVPLDSDPGFGWKEESGRLKLPKAACDKIKAHEMSGLAVTTACATKTPSIPTCGPWSSVQGSSNFDAGAPDVTVTSDAEAGTEASAETSTDSADEDADAGPPQTFYSLNTDFSLAANPFGAWQAGWAQPNVDGGPTQYYPFTVTDVAQALMPFWYDSINYNQGAPVFGINKTGAMAGDGIPDGAAYLLPGAGQQAWVIWTAPGAGTATFHSMFMTGYTGGDVIARILVDGAQVFEQPVNAGSSQQIFDSPSPITTFPGMQIVFVVDSNGPNVGDSVVLRADVSYAGPGATPFRPPPDTSCNMQPPACGMEGMESCCSASEASAGSYNRNNDPSSPATAKFYELGNFEVTVGRFRRFLAEYPGSIPQAGEGLNPLVTGAQGWDPAWTALMPATALELSNALNCDTYPTWTPSVGSNENIPINCVTWYEAAAFCIWDGWYLPTELEWNYAAAGGDEQRIYPWGSNPPEAGLNAIYSETPMVPGTAEMGNGRWWHSDLAGNMGEWVADIYTTSLPLPCQHCVNLTGGTSRVVHDSGWNTSTGEEAKLLTSARRAVEPSTREMGTGFRCARGCGEGQKRCSGPSQPQMCVGGVWMDQAPCAEDQLCSYGGECY